jgi:two-component system, OmpR family, heavy metal sensor histidine kinase CusS
MRSVAISFRIRVFAVAALIVATVLAAVLAIGWSSVMRLAVDRLDTGLCIEAKRVATQPFLGGDLRRLEADIARKLRLGMPEQLLLRFDSAQGGAGFASSGWPVAWRADALTWVKISSAPKFRPAPEPTPIDGDGLRPERIRPAQDHPPGACSKASFSHAGEQWRVVQFVSPQGQGLLAASLASSKAELTELVQYTLGTMLALALPLTALGAWLLSSLAMRPLNRLRLAMKSVTQNALDQRLPDAGEDREFKALIAEYNTMLERLTLSFHQASRFSADAAHELKTPLTILQGRIEMVLSRSLSPDVHNELMGLLDEVSRISMITRKLLLLSQADAGRLALDRVAVNMTELLDELISDAQMLVGTQDLSAQIERGLVLTGDRQLIRQMLNNLISNAVRYCPNEGAIVVRAWRRVDGVTLFFSNDSDAILHTDRMRFFERFYRGDAAHNRAIDGTGLGLSLAREIARAHGGDLTLEQSGVRTVTLRVWLPSLMPDGKDVISKTR